MAVVNKVDDLRNDLTTDTRLEKFYASVACILILLRLNLTPINLAKENMALNVYWKIFYENN